ncbi:hypothetical protein TcasGA2_TC001519 [Tribolium castaneum]|uniref:Uncharacterized protein n=1 Tax=Tribolium castaneum TaxID=7070 RepID=D7EI49_TRICA|nr:hypothetical protein TcasGA2_TC001519 [Tribolium castaneum]
MSTLKESACIYDLISREVLLLNLQVHISEILVEIGRRSAAAGEILYVDGANTQLSRMTEEVANKRQTSAQLCLAIIKTKYLSWFPQALRLTANGTKKTLRN